MTQEEARVKLSEVMSENVDIQKAKMKKLTLVEGLIIAGSLGSMVAAKQLGIDPNNIGMLTTIINTSSLAIYINRLWPVLKEYDRSKQIVNGIEANPDRDYKAVYDDVYDKLRHNVDEEKKRHGK